MARRQYLEDYDSDGWLPPVEPNRPVVTAPHPAATARYYTRDYVGRSRTPSPQRQHRLPLGPGGPVGQRGGSGGHHPSGPQRRRGAGRRLPPTPSQPSTLNIDSLANISMSSKPVSNSMLGPSASSEHGLTAPINFPKLNTSPSRGSLAGVSARKGARLPEVPTLTSKQRSIPLRQGRWSRSLEDPVSFEEAVIAGRGSRQLPTIGPQQLASALGRGRAAAGGQPQQHGGRRELPRPGTTIGFSSQQLHGYPLQHQQQQQQQQQGSHAVVSESEDEDWC